MGVRMNDDREVREERATAEGAEPGSGSGSGSGPGSGSGSLPESGASSAEARDADESTGQGPDRGPDRDPAQGGGVDENEGHGNSEDEGASAGEGEGEGDGGQPAARSTSRRPPTVTTDTARPEGGGRAAPGDAPAPARQWPLLTVVGLTGVGLLIVGLDLFTEAFRVGTILIGLALIVGAVLRRVLPSVGMLAVRSRFTDMITYGLMGVAITLLALVAQPKPWLELPFLEEMVRYLVGR
ncbi:DUF3017 domain-containing protein [Streptomyces yaizuensis]|uniref:DUF3017 domain-containing protein n=1 Tax=Streptomyces yaizuensis TaxID=2989713 RepID=A0ABQ5P5D5_9ACTN|nr:DUF3017 domain-containing protein [Streptomyces sp. YSPA8]GLF97673.1 hypothetical protein SYYSPA8_25270 [Streptomyces sp. YSPA8]